jgi:hypothetical protein
MHCTRRDCGHSARSDGTHCARSEGSVVGGGRRTCVAQSMHELNGEKSFWNLASSGCSVAAAFLERESEAAAAAAVSAAVGREPGPPGVSAAA